MPMCNILETEFLNELKDDVLNITDRYLLKALVIIC